MPPQPPAKPALQGKAALQGKSDDEGTEENIPVGREVADTLRTGNMYEVVVLSAFGGVKQSHVRGPDSIVHPVCLFFLMLPVLVVQTTALVYMKLDYNLAQPVMQASDSAEKDELLFHLKIMMIVTVQATMFSKIMGNLRVLVFLLTPEVWEQMERPWPEDIRRKYHGMAWAYRWLFIGPPAIISMCLHLAVVYSIIKDSVSIIFSAMGMKEAVYDSLAITFLADLGEQWWPVVAMVLHMNANSDFELKTSSPEDVIRRRSSDSGVLRSMKMLFPRGTSGKRWRKSLATALMLLLCVRQAYVVSMAVDTNVLPVARDVCTWWRYNTGRDMQDGDGGLAKQLFFFTERWLVLANPDRAIEDTANPEAHLRSLAKAGKGKAAMAGAVSSAGAESEVFDCHDPTFRPLLWQTMFTLPGKHPWGALRLFALIFVVVAAQVWYHYHKEIMQMLEKPQEDLMSLKQQFVSEENVGFQDMEVGLLPCVRCTSFASSAEDDEANEVEDRRQLQQPWQQLQQPWQQPSQQHPVQPRRQLQLQLRH